MMINYNIIDVRELLPQKGTSVYVDQIVAFDASRKYLEASKKIKEDEYMVKGHFEDNPIVPGILIIESLAQACILCQYGVETNFSSLIRKAEIEYLLYKIDVKFRNKSTINDTLLLQVQLIEVFFKVLTFKVKAIKKDTKEVIAQGEMWVVENQK